MPRSRGSNIGHILGIWMILLALWICADIAMDSVQTAVQQDAPFRQMGGASNE